MVYLASVSTANCYKPPYVGCNWYWLCQGPKHLYKLCQGLVCSQPLVSHFSPLSWWRLGKHTAQKAGVISYDKNIVKVSTWGMFAFLSVCALSTWRGAPRLPRDPWVQVALCILKPQKVTFAILFVSWAWRKPQCLFTKIFLLKYIGKASGCVFATEMSWAA